MGVHSCGRRWAGPPVSADPVWLPSDLGHRSSGELAREGVWVTPYLRKPLSSFRWAPMCSDRVQLPASPGDLLSTSLSSQNKVAYPRRSPPHQPGCRNLQPLRLPLYSWCALTAGTSSAVSPTPLITIGQAMSPCGSHACRAISHQDLLPLPPLSSPLSPGSFPPLKMPTGPQVLLVTPFLIFR